MHVNLPTQENMKMMPTILGFNSSNYTYLLTNVKNIFLDKSKGKINRKTTIPT